MPDSPNNLSQFWQELKRRKVVRVITVYAAAAFVILELLSIIIEPLRLPEWTLQFMIVLLCVGFIIAVILSWIYDVTPEGIEKTKPSEEVGKVDNSATPSSWKIASFISFAVIVALILMNIIPRTKRSSDTGSLDKSIAVLPFTYLSDEPDKQYLADGTMDEILLNLSKIEDLRVMSKTSVEQYRNTDKTVTEICNELDVSFLLEGSFQKNGDQVRLIIQLIEPGEEGHAWAKKYDRSWEDIFTVQSEVAQLVAKELKVVITPIEKQLIELIPTTNLTAHDFYQKGKEEYWKYQSDTDNEEALKRAEELYNKALLYDSTYAQAYIGLAWIYWEKNYWSEFLSDNFMDSVIHLIDIALSFDNQLAEAYNLRGRYYRSVGNYDQALKDYDRALELNPNFRQAYINKANLSDDYIIKLENIQEAIIRCGDETLESYYNNLAIIFQGIGFIDKSRYYYQESFKSHKDTTRYYRQLASLERAIGNYNKALELVERVVKMDSSWIPYSEYYSLAGHYQQQYSKYKKLLKRYEESGDAFGQEHQLAYACWKLGKLEEAEFYFNQHIRNCNESIELNRRIATEKIVQYELAGIYAFQGEKEKAYHYLNEFKERRTFPLWWITTFKTDPLFDSIRNEPKFQQILRDVEAKYQAEHERVRQWLEEND